MKVAMILTLSLFYLIIISAFVPSRNDEVLAREKRKAIPSEKSSESLISKAEKEQDRTSKKGTGKRIKRNDGNGKKCGKNNNISSRCVRKSNTCPD